MTKFFTFGAISVYVAVLINLVFELAHLYGFLWMGVGVAAFIWLSLVLVSLVFNRQTNNLFELLNK